MRTTRFILMLVAALATQSVFAEYTSSPVSDSDNKPCAKIAEACLSAGFVEAKSKDKGIWRNCMKPIMLGNTVTGVTVDPDVAKSCRANKVKELTKELAEFQKAN